MIRPTSPKPLSPKEKSVLEFIEMYFRDSGYSPSFSEIKEHFGFASFNSVQRYIKQLSSKGYIHNPGGNQKRAIRLIHAADALRSTMIEKERAHLNLISTEGHKDLSPQKEASLTGATNITGSTESLSLPLLGRVAAGLPIEAIDHDRTIDVPASLIRRPQQSFALQVEGESMIDDGIFDGDIILVQEQESADNGQMIVATVENEATVKRLYYKKREGNTQVELRPSNKTMSSMWYEPNAVSIRGIVVGLIRSFV